jgi:hypothetical protein
VSYYDDLPVNVNYRRCASRVEALRRQIEEMRQDLVNVRYDVSRDALVDVITDKSARLTRETAALEKWTQAKRAGLEYVDWDYV